MSGGMASRRPKGSSSGGMARGMRVRTVAQSSNAPLHHQQGQRSMVQRTAAPAAAPVQRAHAASHAGNVTQRQQAQQQPLRHQRAHPGAPQVNRGATVAAQHNAPQAAPTPAPAMATAAGESPGDQDGALSWVPFCVTVEALMGTTQSGQRMEPLSRGETVLLCVPPTGIEASGSVIPFNRVHRRTGIVTSGWTSVRPGDGEFFFAPSQVPPAPSPSVQNDATGTQNTASASLHAPPREALPRKVPLVASRLSDAAPPRESVGAQQPAETVRTAAPPQGAFHAAEAPSGASDHDEVASSSQRDHESNERSIQTLRDMLAHYTTEVLPPPPSATLDVPHHNVSAATAAWA